MFVFYIALFVWPFVAPNMLALCIGQVVLALIVGEYHRSQHYGYAYHEAAGFFSWLFGSVVVYAVIVFILGILYPQNSTPTQQQKIELTETIPIVSLRNQSDINGVFHLGYGQIKTSPAYQSMRQNSDGGYVAFITGGETVLYEDATDSGQSRVEIFTRYRRESRSNVPAWVLYISKEKPFTEWIPYEEFHKIHVPQGTVLEEFKVQ